MKDQVPVLCLQIFLFVVLKFSYDLINHVLAHSGQIQ